MNPVLEFISQFFNYGDLPETWQVPKGDRFSSKKTLYDYQSKALEKAARALYFYYGQENDWQEHEAQDVNNQRKRYLADKYLHEGQTNIAEFSIEKHENGAAQHNQIQNPVFKILSEYIPSQGDTISYSHLINRMCFWMATGSGKTLVMVKLIEFLYRLQQHKEIPPHNTLILAPNETLIGQIRRTIDEFNQAGGLQIDLIPLREAGKGAYQRRLGDSVAVYYHRSDNISDVQKESLTDYRAYENGGKWYVFLDEAHKGGKENSKRQAYYALMAREGFLFNFSATFTDKEDIATTVKKYNLEEFVVNGHGKNIYLNEAEYESFGARKKDISGKEKQAIVLKSLITLAVVSQCAEKLRTETGNATLYHRPLMLTLVNSVNTDIDEQNDLYAFFNTLRKISSGDIDAKHFDQAKSKLIKDWRGAKLLFGVDSGALPETGEEIIKKMKMTDLREAVFLSRRRGGLQLIRSKDNKELAFQMKNADSPFALIRIGDTTKWRKELLVGYEETTALKDKSFFDGLEQSSITILMGSRSFFESWDSNRPNVINFINIGSQDAKKFVVQSVGRGVRIEPLKDKRGRISKLIPGLQGKLKKVLVSCRELAAPVETLFLFATNRAAIKSVLAGVGAEKKARFEMLEVFQKAPTPKVNGKAMPLLVPKYKKSAGATVREKFRMSAENRGRIKRWLAETSDSVLMVRDGLPMSNIAALRDMMKRDLVEVSPGNDYAMLSFLQSRLVSHNSQAVVDSDGVREIYDEDIVHFRQIRASHEHAGELREKISQVMLGKLSNDEIFALGEKLKNGEITREEFDRKSQGKGKDKYKELKIKRVAEHYYLPVVLGKEHTTYVQHVIKVESEVNFLNELEKWIENNSVDWDAWMFSKLDESLDRIYIPYYDGKQNAHRQFKPDFVFWMCRGKEYRIVFVDPKGDAHTDAYHKIDGYRNLFRQKTEKNLPRKFSHAGGWKVSVELLMFNPNADPLEKYSDYWTDKPGDIFQAA